jgi:hypothetical protein
MAIHIRVAVKKATDAVVLKDTSQLRVRVRLIIQFKVSIRDSVCLIILLVVKLYVLCLNCPTIQQFDIMTDILRQFIKR